MSSAWIFSASCWVFPPAWAAASSASSGAFGFAALVYSIELDGCIFYLNKYLITNSNLKRGMNLNMDNCPILLHIQNTAFGNVSYLCFKFQ